MLKLFGQTRSRASRSLWMLEEIGIPYEHMPVRPYTESQSAEYLHINPNGHIPSLEDDGFVLWESLAINMYLAETYAGAPLWPAGAKDHALVYQWSLWAANEIGAPDPRAIALEFRAARRRPWHTGRQAGRAIYPRRRLHGRRSQSCLDPSRALRGGISGIAAMDPVPFPMSGAGSLQCAACKSSRSLDEGLDEQQPLETGLAKRHNESGRTCGRSLYKADASLASCPPPMTP